MNIKVKLFLTLVVFFVGLILAGFGRLSRTPVQLNSGVASVEFAAHSSHVAQRPDGSIFLTIVKNEAIRSDGSYSVQQTNIDHRSGQELTIRTIWDKATGRKSRISPSVAAISSTRFDVSRFSAPIIGCDSAILEAPEVGEFLGFRVVETVDNLSGPDRLNTVKRWWAPDLNCYRVYEESIMTDLEGNLRSRNLYQVNTITLGEPDPAFFAIAGDYEEMSPSEAARAELESLGAPQEGIEYHLSIAGVARNERNYQENRWE